MRKRYSCSFTLGADDTSPVQLKHVAQDCLSWMKTRPVVDPSIATSLDVLSPVSMMDVGGSASVDIRCFEIDNSVHWGLRLSHVDHDINDMMWITDLCLRQDNQTNTVEFSCSNGVRSIGSTVQPTSRDFSRPSIVKTITSNWPAYIMGHRLSPTAIPLDSDAVPSFVDFLNATERVRPVVYISASNDTDSPIIVADQLASWLAGVAHVYVAVNRFPSLRLTELMGSSLGCWDGAIRVYWPLINHSDPYRHTFWNAERVGYFEANRNFGIREVVLGKISEAAVYLSDPSAPTWTYLDYLFRQSQINQAKQDGSFDELLGLYDDEIKSLEGQVEDHKTTIRDQEDQLGLSKAQAKSWMDAYRHLAQEHDEEVTEILEFDTVSDSIEVAQREFADKLVFSFNSKSEDDSCPYERPEDVFKVFEFLATTYYDARIGAKQCSNLDLALRETVGWQYRHHQSEATMGKYSDWYKTNHNGVEHQLEEHLRKGSSKDPRYTISIAIAWDGESGRVIVGYLGQHQKTDAT
jgi:hypothetical protein